VKVGDIVQPSALLLKQKSFQQWLDPDSFGLVTNEPRTTYGTWTVHWYGRRDHGDGMRREWLKHAKVKNEAR